MLAWSSVATKLPVIRLMSIPEFISLALSRLMAISVIFPFSYLKFIVMAPSLTSIWFGSSLPKTSGSDLTSYFIFACLTIKPATFKLNGEDSSVLSLLNALITKS